MALIRCPECGRQISDDAAMCMGCGKPMEKIREQLAAEKAETEKLKAANKPANGKKPIGLFIALAAVIAVIAVVLMIVSVTGKRRVNFTKADVVKDHVITFGAYEQDNDLTNGKEPIEWIVLDVDKKTNRALVISRYALDAKAYNDELASITWETCSIRAWLNGEFMKAAFSSDEQKAILMVTVSADKNPDYINDPGNATQDKVFLLSITEVNKYFKNDDARMCAPTDYAIKNGAWTSSSSSVDGRATCYWWLRSPGFDNLFAADVFHYGIVGTVGDSVRYSGIAVRPALYIDLNLIP